MGKPLGSLMTAMVTSFNRDGSLNLKGAQALARSLVRFGSDGVVVVGTTGESPTLTHEEDVELFIAVREAIGDMACVVAGTGSNSTSEALMKTQKAEEVGVHACLLVVPYYNKPNQQGLYLHFKTIAENTSLPCIIYNVPGRTGGQGILPETVARLSEIENIVGIKECASLEQVWRIKALARDGFLIWSGDDDKIRPIIAMGGYGAISVSSHLVGPKISKMIIAQKDGDDAAAKEIEKDLMPIFKAMFIDSNPIPVKYALNALGINVGGLRLPLCELDADKSQEVDRILPYCSMLPGF